MIEKSSGTETISKKFIANEVLKTKPSTVFIAIKRRNGYAISAFGINYRGKCT
jgi:hypothetical protein